ncbi:MAG: GNAT family N-acetyltransferase [Cystobacterineae bacterium]|nr:GNAT family N-acetyltransferase [Cystobacterineae bacterium]
MQKKNVILTKATPADLEAILALQRLAYQSEARIYEDFGIQPLRQTLEELRQECARSVVFKALDEAGKLIGSVRAYAENDTTYIHKLIVAPEHQNQGLGKRLLEAAENAFPSPRFELHTGHKSIKNLALYERCGYVRFKEEAGRPTLRLVYLEKWVTRTPTV